MAHLEIETPRHQGLAFEVSQAEVMIGRDPKNDLVLEDPRVSRQHALLRREGSEVTIVDLESGNGTLVNGRHLRPREPHQLRDRDVIRIGNCTLTLRLDEARRDPHEFREVMQRTPHQMLTGALVGSGAVVLSTEELRRELRKRDQLLRLFYELGEKLGSIFSLEEIYEQVFEILMQATPASRCFIFRKNEQSEFTQVGARMRDAGEVGEPLPISKTIFERVARERISVLLDNATLEQQQLLSPESLLFPQVHSVMAAPIIGPRGLLGIIYADLHDHAAFAEQDLDILNAVAVQTGIAINTVINHERLQRQAQARASFERFLPRTVVEEILRSPERIKLGGVRQKVTALFADLRGFTTLSENSPPELIVNLLNQYFTLVSEIIFRHGGTLDKYIGDGLLALFGAPYVNELDAVQAVRAAVAMQRAMADFNARLQSAGMPEVAIGIGINTGPAILGYIGSETRLDYTAIGDTVNTAARLESIAQPGQIVISENTVQALDENTPVRLLGTERLKGKQINLRTYEILWR
jgi:adenylate cyclase